MWESYDQLFRVLLAANQISQHASYRIDVACSWASEAPEIRVRPAGEKVTRRVDPVDDPVGSLLALLGGLLVESRMALVTMVFMSGLWPRLVASHVEEQECADWADIIEVLIRKDVP